MRFLIVHSLNNYEWHFCIWVDSAILVHSLLWRSNKKAITLRAAFKHDKTLQNTAACLLNITSFVMLEFLIS